MWITFDSEADALYISFRALSDDEYVAYTDPMDESRNVDFDALDEAVGVEILNVRAGVDLSGLPNEAEIRATLDRLALVGR